MIMHYINIQKVIYITYGDLTTVANIHSEIESKVEDLLFKVFKLILTKHGYKNSRK